MNNPNQIQSVVLTADERAARQDFVDAQIDAMGREAARNARFANAVRRFSVLQGGEQPDGQALPADRAMRGGLPHLMSRNGEEA